MGMLQFALEGNYKRYINNLKELSKETGKSAFGMFLDTGLCTLFLGSGLQDYLGYKFYEKSWKERRTYATIGDMNRYYKTLSPEKYAPFMSNKLNFHRNYSDYTRRDFFDPKTQSLDEFIAFTEKHPAFVRKPEIGLAGRSVEKIRVSEIEDLSAFYQDMKDNRLFAEELVVQDPRWAVLSPDSVNTLRIVTTALDGKAEIVFAGARVGSGKSVADNFHQGGTAVPVDLETGRLVGDAVNKTREYYKLSPGGIPYDGFQVPDWDKVRELVLNAALVEDRIHFVGWDVAIGADGPLLIEGNRGPGMDIVQMLLGHGARYMLTDLYKAIKKNGKKK